MMYQFFRSRNKMEAMHRVNSFEVMYAPRCVCAKIPLQVTPDLRLKITLCRIRTCAWHQRHMNGVRSGRVEIGRKKDQTYWSQLTPLVVDC